MTHRAVIKLLLVTATFAALTLSTSLGAGCGPGLISGSGDTAANEDGYGTTGTTAPSSPATTATSMTIAVSTTTVAPAEIILERMSLREKAAQVLLLAFDGTTLSPDTVQLLRESPPGGLLLLTRNVSDPRQLLALTMSAQAAVAAGGSEVGLLIAVDQEGGSVQRIHSGLPRIPAARDLGDDAALEEARLLAAETAAGLLELGVNTNLAPVADVVSDARSFLYKRTYSGDPTVVADFVATVTDAYAQKGVIVVVKHFPGHGCAPGDSHGGPVVSDVGEFDFATVHLPPFKAALSAGAEGVMMAHILVRAYDPVMPASLSSTVIEDVLRDGLGFSGLVVADDLEMAGAAVASAAGENTQAPNDDPGELAVLALAAGCDLLISTGTLPRQTAMIDAIVEAVESGRLSQSRLDHAVSRMLEIKLRHDLITPLSAP